MTDEYTLYAIHSRYRPRAEPIRMIFHYGKQPFKDVHVDASEFGAMKDKVPLRQFPTIEVKSPGKTFMLGQTTTILRFLARKFDLMPKDEVEEALCDMYGEYIQEFEDLIARWQWSLYTQSYWEIEADFFKGKVVGMANRIGKVLSKAIEKNGTGFLVGSKLTWSDIFLAEVVDKLYAFHKKNDLFAEYPVIEKHHNMVYSLPELLDYVSNRPQFVW
ncbi:putative glutathione S-transferase gst-36 [Ditylenchus destructor]|uniref:Glutathione S-transferase gst-36 n=1 Tax=Ditylenchus destructor TaxID=166010 RepID=A0AAD4N4P2_9BILA|nr:putative glutathione S-transferase gst-36 [Ditylenchus destructor]